VLKRSPLIVLAALTAAGCIWSAAPAFAQAAAPATPGVTITGDYGGEGKSLLRAVADPSGFFPPDVSKHGWEIDRLIDWMHYFMAALFVGWGAFFVYCLWRFRARGGHAACYDLIKAKPSKWAEIGVAAFEAVLLIGFSMPIWASVKSDPPHSAGDPEAIRVRVVAEQFAWNFHYPGADNEFGATAPQFVNTATNPLGVDPSDSKGKDDITSSELHLPTKRAVVCEIVSKDVIHSFFLPVMRIKQDAIPGMRIPVWFEAKEGSDGIYEVACAQLCGNNHYSMRALMYLHPQAAYDAWLAEKGKPPEEFEE
jgi:cytochrome c oxidase subunit 2